MARRDTRAYEYEYGYHSEHRHRRKRNPRLRLLDTVLLITVIIVPLIGLILWLLDVPVPLFWLGLYTTVTQTVGGLLFVIFTACGVGGFGKVGYFFSHTRGKRWMTPKEAKGNTYLFGTIMLTIGVLVALWTFKAF